MRRLAPAILLLVLIHRPAFAEFPFPTWPDWISHPGGQYATGGALVDVDGDGWLDLVVANGNDMARQPIAVYHNDGTGAFPLEPTWTSADVDYHGHLDVGDVNGDGLPDLVVAVYLGPGGFGDPGYAKLYLNDGAGAFHPLPDWISQESFATFSVALGDADGDGDLDLACACGDGYFGDPEPQRIFMNVGGTFEPVASWRSEDAGYALDVFWGDVDDDGDMDPVFCGMLSPLRIYRNDQTDGGGISTLPTWQNEDLPELGNTCTLGDWDGDGFPELAVADNNQVGGEGRFKVYANVAGELAPIPTWTSATGGYGSHVSWVDLDGDGDLDLAAGRWWDAVRIYENLGGTLSASPAWISATHSVIENIVWGDVDNGGLRPDLLVAAGDGSRTFFGLPHQPVRWVESVSVDGTPVPFAVHPANAWVSVSPPPPAGSTVSIEYTYSPVPDMVVTNWDPDEGNYLFLNQGPAASPAPAGIPGAVALRVEPQPLRHHGWISYRGPELPRAELTLYDVTGKRLATLHAGPLRAGRRRWKIPEGVALASGTYFLLLEGPGVRRSAPLVVLR
jgi:hypothetical protein